jgi:hypothetical protein
LLIDCFITQEPSMSLSQIETVRAARLQLIDLGDEKTAALLEWALKEQAAPSTATPAPPPARQAAGRMTRRLNREAPA